MSTETGHISIHAENILPIIKRWLYSEKDIYIRELIANAADAVTKLQKLALVGEVKTTIAEPKLTVTINKEAKTLTISDTGLGMTADEVKKYINQVAFSGVKDFVSKYQDKADDQQIIGHFGLGFYSSYMVAGKVAIVGGGLGGLYAIHRLRGMGLKVRAYEAGSGVGMGFVYWQ